MNKENCIDHLGRVLVKQQLFTKRDTYWAALAYRVYESESTEKLAALRQKLLLYFASLVFGQSFDDFDDFNRQMRHVEPQPRQLNCYRHPAIQMWVYQLHKLDPELQMDIRELDHELIKERAISFIRVNNMPGNCSCRFTIGYLFAAVYSYDVYLRDVVRHRTDVLQAPFGDLRQDQEIDVTLIDCPMHEQAAIQRGKEEFYVYIYYTGASFELWLPQMSMSSASSAHWLSRGASTAHVRQSVYKLVRLDGEHVEPIGYFAQQSAHVYYCIVPGGESAKGIYRVLPGAANKLILDTPLFIYTSRGMEKGDVCTMAGYIDGDGTPAAFLLDPAKDRLVVAISHASQLFAERCITEELKLKV